MMLATPHDADEHMATATGTHMHTGSGAARAMPPAFADTASFAVLDTLGWLPLGMSMPAPGEPGEVDAGAGVLLAAVEELRHRLVGAQPLGGLHTTTTTTTTSSGSDQQRVRRISALCARHITAASVHGQGQESGAAGCATAGGGQDHGEQLLEGQADIVDELTELVLHAAVTAPYPLTHAGGLELGQRPSSVPAFPGRPGCISGGGGGAAGPLDPLFVAAVAERHGGLGYGTLGASARGALWRLQPHLLTDLVFDMVQAVTASTPLLGQQAIASALQWAEVPAICARHLELWMRVAGALEDMVAASSDDWRVLRIADVFLARQLAAMDDDARVLASLAAAYGGTNAGVVLALFHRQPHPLDPPAAVVAAAAHVAALFSARQAAAQPGGGGSGIASPDVREAEYQTLRCVVLQRAGWLEALFGAQMLLEATPTLADQATNKQGSAPGSSVAASDILNMLCWIVEAKPNGRGRNDAPVHRVHDGSPTCTIVQKVCAAATLDDVVAT